MVITPRRSIHHGELTQSGHYSFEWEDIGRAQRMDAERDMPELLWLSLRRSLSVK